MRIKMENWEKPSSGLPYILIVYYYHYPMFSSPLGTPSDTNLPGLMCSSNDKPDHIVCVCVCVCTCVCARVCVHVCVVAYERVCQR